MSLSYRHMDIYKFAIHVLIYSTGLQQYIYIYIYMYVRMHYLQWNYKYCHKQVRMYTAHSK